MTPDREIIYLKTELEKAQGDLKILRHKERQLQGALKLAREDLDADEWPENLDARDVIDKYLVGPAVQYIAELEGENERLQAIIAGQDT